MPDATGYLDTLAEVHFQRGDKDDAIALMKRVIKLAPDNKFYPAQLRRMEAGDPKAELPEQ